MRVPNTRYYLGRVVKIGGLTQDLLINALLEPATLDRGKYHYTIVDQRRLRVDEIDFVVGRLAKFTPQSEVAVIDPYRHLSGQRPVENAIVATSTFAYIPDTSGIAYQHVWNQLESEQFEELLPAVVLEKYGRVLVDCKIEPITDLRTFVQRLGRLERIVKIDATVHPPNPLFGPAWEDLRNYLLSRNADEVEVRETSEKGLVSQLPEIARTASRESESSHLELPVAPVPIGDAAVLMAADGYGKARIEGRENEKRVVIWTRENQISFELPKDAPDEDVCRETARRLFAVSDERGLKH